MKRLSKEQKKRNNYIYQAGLSPKEIGKKFGIYNNSVTRILLIVGGIKRLIILII